MNVSVQSHYKRWFGFNALAWHVYVITYLNLLPDGAWGLALSLLVVQFAWHIFGAFMAHKISVSSPDRKFFFYSCLNPGIGYFYGKRHGFLAPA